jgi:hypothetical protein
MMGRKARLGTGAATAALAVLAVAGCSGSGSGSGAGGTGTTGDSAALSLVADAMNKADSAGTVKVTGTITAPGTSVPMTMTAEEQYSPSVEMSMSMQVEGQTMSEVLIGDVIYMDYPALSAELGGKQWAEIDLSKANGSLGSLSSLVSSAKNENPTTQISALVASGEVSKVGTATVNGQQTTHYSGTMTASQLLDTTTLGSHLTAAQLSNLKDTLQSGGVTSETVDVWIASTGLPVEMKYSAKTANGAIGGDLFMSDWGAPVSVGAPPAAEVYNMTDQLSKAAASATSTKG